MTRLKSGDWTTEGVSLMFCARIGMRTVAHERRVEERMIAVMNVVDNRVKVVVVVRRIESEVVDVWSNAEEVRISDY